MSPKWYFLMMLLWLAHMDATMALSMALYVCIAAVVLRIESCGQPRLGKAVVTNP
jgi:hypothetical protein